MLIKTELI